MREADRERQLHGWHSVRYWCSQSQATAVTWRAVGINGTPATSAGCCLAVALLRLPTVVLLALSVIAVRPLAAVMVMVIVASHQLLLVIALLWAMCRTLEPHGYWEGTEGCGGRGWLAWGAHRGDVAHTLGGNDVSVIPPPNLSLSLLSSIVIVVVAVARRHLSSTVVIAHCRRASFGCSLVLLSIVVICCQRCTLLQWLFIVATHCADDGGGGGGWKKRGDVAGHSVMQQ